MPEVIIFDLDDTIIAWETASPKLWEDVCAALQNECGGIEPAVLAAAVREAGRVYWSDEERHRAGRLDLFNTRRKVAAAGLAGLGIHDTNLAYRIADRYSRQREESAGLYPEALAVLGDLRRRGIRLAMATNGAGDMQRGKIERFGLEKYFEYILVEGEFGAGKPDAGVFRHVLGKMKVTTDKAWMVGDNLKRDIAPCLDLGIFAVWVDINGKGLREDTSVQPDRIIGNISELPGLLDDA